MRNGILPSSYESIALGAAMEDCVDQLAILGLIIPSTNATNSYQKSKSSKVGLKPC